jgi:hypothetical protein
VKNQRLLQYSVAVLALATPALAAPAKRAKQPAAHAVPVEKTANSEIGGTLQYKVQPGDTLRSIVYNYFANSHDKAVYDDVWKLNHIQNPNRLTVGSTLFIPRAYLSVVPARALLTAFRGEVTLDKGRPAKINTVLTEGAHIATGANSSVSLTLEDGSTISLPSQSNFVLEKLRLVLISGELEHVFRLDKGRSEFTVSPSRGPAGRFQVKTPVSVSAVRGTEFRVEVEEGGTSSINEVLKDDVAVTGKTGADLDLREGFGAKADVKGVGKPVKLLGYPEVLLPIYHHPNGSLTFNIRPIDGAVKYRLQIASDLTFQDVRDEVVSDKPVFSVPTAPVGNYYVKVTAIDPQGIEGLQHIYPFAYNK